jgi:nitrite reductase/ring-hydroxylating ferredoxin subunit
MAGGKRLICVASDLEDGARGIRFEIDCGRERRGAFAVRYAGRVYAYFNRCAHAEVELDWQPGEFFDGSKLYLICATHGALYAPESGRCLGGRCDGRGLQPIPVVECDGLVYVIESE